MLRRLSIPAGLLALDLLLVLAAWWLAFWLRFNLEIPPEFGQLAAQSAPLAGLSYAAVLLALRLYRQVWSYTGLPELRRLVAAIGLAALLAAGAVLMLRLEFFPRSVLLLHPLLVLLLLAAARALWRTAAEGGRRRNGRPLLVVGRLREAATALRQLQDSQQWRPVAILSPDPDEVGRMVQGLPVAGTPEATVRVARDSGADTALVACPAGSQERRDALLRLAQARLALLTPPRPDQWLQGESAGPRQIELDDLLGRPSVALDVNGLAGLMSGQVVLVTGAGGSIGSELCRQVARLGVARLVCVDQSEFAIYQLEQELRQSHPQMHASWYVANVREAGRLAAICARHRPVLVLHAAACKHVPLMEELNEIEALRTNVLGTVNAARAAAAAGAQRFVLVSTDKAVNPTSVMGASKRLAELAMQAVAREAPGTHFVAVRFGNVLGSSGSVVPLFTAQIARGGPVTVTHPEIVRYFMTIPEAAQLVLQAGLMGRSGQIFVLDMGEPVKIVDLARMLIRLSGRTEQDVPITYIGLRPGEKLYEELLASDETSEPTPHPKLRIAKVHGQAVSLPAIEAWIAQAGPQPAGDSLRAWLREQVPEYQPRIP